MTKRALYPAAKLACTREHDCPATGKRSYRHRKHCLQAIAEAGVSVALWPYKCEQCRKWHMTKQRQGS